MLLTLFQREVVFILYIKNLPYQKQKNADLYENAWKVMSKKNCGIQKLC